MRKPVGKILLAVFIGVIALGAYGYHTAINAVKNSYALWWVAEMVSSHLEENQQSWPRSWDELRDDYEAAVKQVGRPWTFEELSRRVVVDWNVETASLEEAIASGDDFRAIWLSDGTNAHWERREPNQMIRNYLVNRRPADALTAIRSSERGASAP